jgi:hypothetical protein
MEELKLILDMVSKATDSAITFAMWWLVKDGFVDMFGYAVGIIAIMVTYKLLNPIVGILSINDFGKSLRAIACLTQNYGEFTTSEKMTILNMLRRGKEAMEQDNENERKKHDIISKTS